MRLLGISVVPFRRFSNPSDKVTLSLGVCRAVILVCIREFHFEIAIFLGNVWIVNEVVPKEESVPMLEMELNHVDVMRSVPIFITLDKPGIERRSIIPK